MDEPTESPRIRILRAELAIVKEEYAFVLDECKTVAKFPGSVPDKLVKELLRDRAIKEQQVIIAEAKLEQGLAEEGQK